MMKYSEVGKTVQKFIILIAASFVMACNIRFLVRNAGLFPGGATGLSLLIQEVGGKYMNLALPFTPINILINAVPVYIGWKYIGRKFTLYSLLVIVLTGFFTDLLPAYEITDDILLTSVFGGIINGLVLKFVLSADATTGGTDFIAIFLSNRKGADSFNVSLYINAGILLAAGYLFGWDKALYSIIFQYVSTQMLHATYKKYQKQTLLVVTNQPDLVCRTIFEVSHHGATVLDGEGAYEHEQRKLVYSVVSAAEYTRVINAVKKADGTAFINTLNTNRLSGRFYQPPTE